MRISAITDSLNPTASDASCQLRVTRAIGKLETSFGNFDATVLVIAPDAAVDEVDEQEKTKGTGLRSEAGSSRSESRG